MHHFVCWIYERTVKHQQAKEPQLVVPTSVRKRGGVIGTPPAATGEFQYHKCGSCKICPKFSVMRVAGSV
jgi:hypothetical protein